jgi:hypothetical protein
MSRGRPLSLTAEQLILVIEAARSVPWRRRSRFLNSVADQLHPNVVISNDAVQEAVRRSIVRMTGVAA